MIPSSPPRLNVEITAEQNRELNRLLPWGTRAHVFRVLVDDLITLLKRDPDATVGMLLARHMKVHDFPSFPQEQSHGDD